MSLKCVGYGRLSPRTALGKIVAMLYALVGVPLMLVLLSLMGSLLADSARKGYAKICCAKDVSKTSSSIVGYHRTSSCTSIKYSCKNTHDGKHQFWGTYATSPRAQVPSSEQIFHNHHLQIAQFRYYNTAARITWTTNRLHINTQSTKKSRRKLCWRPWGPVIPGDVAVRVKSGRCWQTPTSAYHNLTGRPPGPFRGR